MEDWDTAASKICEWLKRNGRYKIMFLQTLPGSDTQVSIDLPANNNMYTVQILNNRSDAVIHSSPITDVFKKILPSLYGTIEIDKKEMAAIFTELVSAKRYFGIDVHLTSVPVYSVLDKVRL